MTAIYTEHFALRDAPFSLAPDPRYLYASEQHRDALAHLLFGARGEGGFVLLSGEVGTGKTTLFRCFLDQVPETTKVAFVLHPRLTALELLATVCDEFGIRYPVNTRSTKRLVDRIYKFLLAEADAGRRAIVVIDEAQNLGTDVLEELRLLTNLETSRRKLLQIILIGQDELGEKLGLPEMRQLSQRVTARCHLGPLRKDEVGPYIAHRLEVAGGRPGLFHPSAARVVFRHTRGVPRLINILCDRALLGAYSVGAEKVTGDILTRAAREVGVRGAPPVRPALAAAFLASAALLLLLAVRSAIMGTAPLPSKGRPPTAGAAAGGSPWREAGLSGGDMTPRGTTRDLAWLFEQAGRGSDEEAGRILFSLWGDSAGGEAGGDLCDAAKTAGLQCLTGRGNLADLAALNRPAVLRMVSFEGRTFNVVLKALQGERASILFAGGEGTVDLRWLGEYVLLWRPPPGYDGPLHPGGRYRGVAWLRARIGAEARADAEEGDADVYDSGLAGKVRSFQRSRGIADDGIVGPVTVIHINTASGEDVPLLAGGGGG